MTNTTHINSISGSQADRGGDTGVICFCQKHRNSFPTPPGLHNAGMHSLACHRVLDLLLLWLPASVEEGIFFSEDLWKKCHRLPSAMISAPAMSWVSSEGKSV